MTKHATTQPPTAPRQPRNDARQPRKATRRWERLGGAVTARRSWGFIVLALLAAAALSTRGLPASSQNSPAYLPPDAESAVVDGLLREFPGGGATPVIAIVARRDGAALTSGDIAATAQAQARMLAVDRHLTAGADGQSGEADGHSGEADGPSGGAPSPDGPVGGGAPDVPAPDDPAQGTRPEVLLAQDRAAAIVAVPVGADLTGFALRDVVRELRRAAGSGLPSSLSAQVTGGPAFGADIADAFDGADLRLLLVTAAVVAVLLMLTYRSPILWLVPLLVVALADRLAQLLAGIVTDGLGWALDGSTTGITSVLVFGAGTNYALLLVSRYRQELARGEAGEGHRAALARAVAVSAPAIVASNATVVASLLLLVFAVVPATRVLGVSAATGLLVTLLVVPAVLPAALALTGPRLFWPFVPATASGDREPSGGWVASLEATRWFRLAAAVARRPVASALVVIAALGGCATGLRATQVGLDQVAQFRVASESVAGYRTASAHFPAGMTNPTLIVARVPEGRAAHLQAAITATPGVAVVAPTGRTATLTRWQVVLADPPASTRALRVNEDLRARTRAVVGDVGASTAGSDIGVWVGGGDARQLDANQAAQRDRVLLLPLIMVLVLGVLVLLLRAVWAPLVLIACTALSAGAALGVGAPLAQRLLDRDALDVLVPLLAALFLIALGVDYTIFLVTRAREEAATHGTRAGMIRALALTGGVITSAGLVLAAVFAVLGVLPLIVLGQLGTIVGLGILIDTLVVRTMLIPALFAWTGPRIWWPSAPPNRGHRPRHRARAPSGRRTPRRASAVVTYDDQYPRTGAGTGACGGVLVGVDDARPQRRASAWRAGVRAWPTSGPN